MVTENRQCQNCKSSFSFEPNDLGFYEKMKVPLPTFCPPCRRERRNAWRNSLTLYSRKCDLCEKSVVSIYSPDSGITIYCNKCWWSDNWDPKSFAMDYDFSRPFFTQFKELINKVPHMSVINDNNIASINCEYTHDIWFSKNCYMVFSGWRIENVMYSFFAVAGKDYMDCMNIRSKNEWLYECIICADSYQLKYSQYSKACIESAFLFNCINCTNCFMCYGIVGKRYYFQNKQYTKEEYEKILADYRLDTFSGVEKAKKDFTEFISRYFKRYAQIFHSVNCTGDVISYSKNLKDCYVVKQSENCRYGEFFNGVKDSHDLVMTGESSECYESVVVDHSQHNFWGLFSVKSQDMYYTQHCHSSKNLFGCVGLKKASYCIFNKQYTKEEYEELVPKIIAQMNDMPYIDKAGRVYKYGEFYPIELSPFGYNETLALEQSNLTKEEALSKGYNWQDNLQRTTGKETLKITDIPDSINLVEDAILEEVLSCVSCHRNYKIIPNELLFYKKMSVPIPRKCFYCRHNDRIKLRNPFKLWHGACACTQDNHEHRGKCANEFETNHDPSLGEKVYCEQCYQHEMY